MLVKPDSDVCETHFKNYFRPGSSDPDAVLRTVTARQPQTQNPSKVKRGIAMGLIAATGIGCCYLSSKTCKFITQQRRARIRFRCAFIFHYLNPAPRRFSFCFAHVFFDQMSFRSVTSASATTTARR
jgi:hypothetical protein